jgi:hypothetical protein
MLYLFLPEHVLEKMQAVCMILSQEYISKVGAKKMQAGTTRPLHNTYFKRHVFTHSHTYDHIIYKGAHYVDTNHMPVPGRLQIMNSVIFASQVSPSCMYPHVCHHHHIYEMVTYFTHTQRTCIYLAALR